MARTEQDQNTYVHMEFYEGVVDDIGRVNELINADSDALAGEGASILGIAISPATFSGRNYLMAIIHYRATKRSTLFD
jgi:hypothetical protein